MVKANKVKNILRQHKSIHVGHIWADHGPSIKTRWTEGWMQQVSQTKSGIWTTNNKGCGGGRAAHITQNLSNNTYIQRTVVDRQKVLQAFKMSGIAAKLQHNRDKSRGIGSNSHAVKYLNQDFDSLRRSCLERGQLFEDDCFEALPSSLGFNELGPNSYKVRGITWKRPTVW